MTAVPVAPPATALEGVSIVLPCHDEAPNLIAAVKMASEAGRRNALAHEVIVVDDGSRDRTLSIATARPRRTPRDRPPPPAPHPPRRGAGLSPPEPGDAPRTRRRAPSTRASRG